MSTTTASAGGSARAVLQQHASTVASHYLRNQPRYQTAMMTSFSVYVLAATYAALSPSKKRKSPAPGTAAATATVVAEDAGGGGGRRRKKRGPRVEVSLDDRSPSTALVSVLVLDPGQL